ELSKTSTRPPALSAAYRRVPAPLMAGAGEKAPGGVTFIVDGRPPAPPGNVPFTAAKMKRAEMLDVPGVSWKEAVFVLLTWPVGPWGPAAVVGIPTNPCALTAST